MNLVRAFGSFALGILVFACHRASDPKSHAQASVAPIASASAPLVASAQPSRSAELLELERVCTKVCQRSVDLKCSHSSECVPNCMSMGSVAACQQEFKAFYRCLLQEPLEHWRCGEDGIAAILEGFCDREQEAAISCMEQAVKQ